MHIPYTLTDQSLTVLGRDFTPKTLPASHPAFDEAVAALRRGDAETLFDLLDLKSAIVEYAQGDITVTDRQLYFRGRPLDSMLTRRILQFMDSGQTEFAKPLMNFLEKVMNNPSGRAVRGLFEWVERSNLPITPEGHILAWKIVRDDYLDVYSGRFDNSIGKVVEVPRNDVDEDPSRTCSYGLHFCSTAYLPHYGGFEKDRRVVIVKIDPADVVAFPRDYNTSKGRACRYTVIGEVPGDKAKEFFPDLVTDPDDWDNDHEGVFDDLELDRYYRTRAGDIALVRHYYVDEDLYPYEGCILGGGVHAWTPEGLWSVYQGEHPNDLVELLPEGFEPDEDQERVSKPKGFFSWLFP